MNIKLVTRGGPGKPENYCEFMIKTESDVANLPTSVRNDKGEVAEPGSFAFTQDLQHKYLLGLDDTWREV